MFDGHMFGYGSIIMWLFWVLLIVAIALAVYALAGSRRHEEKSTLDMLKERYARGEINQQEYEGMWEVLISEKD